MSFILPRAFESTWQHSTQPVIERPVLFVIFIALAFLNFRILYSVFLYPRLFSPLRNIPGPPLGHPIYGQAVAIINGETCIPQREWVKKYGPVVRVVGPIGIEHLIFTTPEAIEKILVSDWIDYPRPKFVRDVLGLITGHGLLTMSGNVHKQIRKIIHPAFSIPNLMAQNDKYYGPIEGLVDILRTQINSEKEPGNGKEILIYNWLSKVTLDITCEAALGCPSDSLHNPHNKVAEAYQNFSREQSGAYAAKLIAMVCIPGATKLIESEWAYKNRHWLAKFNPTRSLFVLLDSIHQIRKGATEMMQKNLRDSEATVLDSETKCDIISVLNRARKAELYSEAGWYAMSEEDMMEQLLSCLAADETMAAGLAWTIWLLAKDPESQEKLRAEVAPLFAENPRPDYRAVKELQWLDCVIQESMRLMPPVPMTLRQAAKSDVIDGVFVPKGTFLSIPIRVINTRSEVWGNDAEDFNPARWLNLPPTYKPAFSTLTFLSGPHACIGKPQVLSQMKAVLGALISNFEFEPAYAGQVPQPTAAITMKPQDDMPLRIRVVS